MNPTEEPKKNPIHSLRTYQGDVEEVMSKNNTSGKDIYLAEQKRRDSSLINPEIAVNNEAKNKFYILIGSILLVLGVITIISVYYLRSTEQIAIIQKTKALTGFSQERLIPLKGTTREQFIAKMINEKQSFNLPINSVLYVDVVDDSGNPANLIDTLHLLAPQMPDSLIRSFGTKYMIGVYSFDTNEFFIIIKTNDFASSFSGMLKWEPNIQNDIGSLFGLSKSTTTPVFQDEEFRNKDVRMIRGADNKTILLYSFIDKDTLVITKNENIFTAVISKYLVNGQVQ